MPAGIGCSLRRGGGGPLYYIWGVQTHSGHPVFLALFRKDLASMKGTPQASQKCLPAKRIEPASLNPESQPSTIEPLLTPTHPPKSCVKSDLSFKSFHLNNICQARSSCWGHASKVWVLRLGSELGLIASGLRQLLKHVTKTILAISIQYTWFILQISKLGLLSQAIDAKKSHDFNHDHDILYFLYSTDFKFA